MRMTEASPIASQAVSSDAPQVQRKCSCGGSCDNCLAELGQGQLQRKQGEASGLGQDESTPTVQEVLRSPGAPLDAGTRAFMEPRLGQDFSRVRVHSGTLAAQSARDINARAYTTGHNIVFGAGEFSPASHEGRSLLVHELAHVIQQTSGSVPTLQRKEKRDPDNKKPAIVKIVAFAESTDAAVAYAADDSETTLGPEPIQLKENALKKGEYTYRQVASAEYSQVRDQQETGLPTFLWYNPFIEGTHDVKYAWAKSVKVVILPRYIEDFLTDREGSKPSAKPAEVVEILEAAQILAKKGVTEDQLVLEQHKRMDRGGDRLLLAEEPIW